MNKLPPGKKPLPAIRSISDHADQILAAVVLLEYCLKSLDPALIMWDGKEPTIGQRVKTFARMFKNPRSVLNAVRVRNRLQHAGREEPDPTPQELEVAASTLISAIAEIESVLPPYIQQTVFVRAARKRRWFAGVSLFVLLVLAVWAAGKVDWSFGARDEYAAKFGQLSHELDKLQPRIGDTRGIQLVGALLQLRDQARSQERGGEFRAALSTLNRISDGMPATTAHLTAFAKGDDAVRSAKSRHADAIAAKEGVIDFGDAPALLAKAETLLASESPEAAVSPAIEAESLFHKTEVAELDERNVRIRAEIHAIETRFSIVDRSSDQWPKEAAVFIRAMRPYLVSNPKLADPVFNLRAVDPGLWVGLLRDTIDPALASKEGCFSESLGTAWCLVAMSRIAPTPYDVELSKKTAQSMNRPGLAANSVCALQRMYVDIAASVGRRPLVSEWIPSWEQTIRDGGFTEYQRAFAYMEIATLAKRCGDDATAVRLATIADKLCPDWAQQFLGLLPLAESGNFDKLIASIDRVKMPLQRAYLLCRTAFRLAIEGRSELLDRAVVAATSSLSSLDQSDSGSLKEDAEGYLVAAMSLAKNPAAAEAFSSKLMVNSPVDRLEVKGWLVAGYALRGDKANCDRIYTLLINATKDNPARTFGLAHAAYYKGMLEAGRSTPSDLARWVFSQPVLLQRPAAAGASEAFEMRRKQTSK
ncbi:MAG: hypothetical protein U0638_12145 [Phycisphaerales bacterium]